MEPTLVVIGVSLRSAKLAMRERFLLNSTQKVGGADGAGALGCDRRSDRTFELQPYGISCLDSGCFRGC